MMMENKIRWLFRLLYFSELVNTFIAFLYQSLSLTTHVNSLYFSIILTICPALGGFAIDHVQYTLNLLCMSQYLTILSYIYFLAYCVLQIQVYLFFAICFQMLAYQLQTILILAMISKHFSTEEIPKQISYFYLFGYIGKFACFLFIVGIATYYQLKDLKDIYSSSQFLQIISVIPGIIFTSLTMCIYRSFPTFRKDIYSLIPEIEHVPIQARGNLLQAIKELLNTDRAVIAMAAGSIMSIIAIWFQYQYLEIQNVFKDFSAEIINYFDQFEIQIPEIASLLQGISIIVSIIFAPIIGNKISRKRNALNYLSLSAIYSLLFFLMNSLQVIYSNGILFEKIFIYICTLLAFQYIQTSTAISCATLIGVQKQNYRTQGLSFGLLAVFNNIFKILVYSVLNHFSGQNKQSYSNNLNKQQAQLSIILIFAISYSIIGTIISKTLEFLDQQRLTRIYYQSKNYERLQTTG